jgi:hypothetical protein
MEEIIATYGDLSDEEKSSKRTEKRKTPPDESSLPHKKCRKIDVSLPNIFENTLNGITLKFGFSFFALEY